MAKAKRKRPYRPPVQGDIGPDTKAQRKGAVVTYFREDNGLEYRRRRRDHALEIMRSAATISARQCAAGLKLHELWCITEMTGDAPFTKVYVDTSPNPAAVAVAQAERLAAFVALSKHIPAALRGPVDHVAIKGRQLRDGYSRDSKDASSHAAQLQVGLDILANELRM